MDILLKNKRVAKPDPHESKLNQTSKNKFTRPQADPQQQQEIAQKLLPTRSEPWVVSSSCKFGLLGVMKDSHPY